MDETAKIVFERNHTCTADAGPCEYGRIGFAIGSRVFWVASFYFPGTPLSEYAEAVSFCNTVAARWNASVSTQDLTQ